MRMALIFMGCLLAAAANAAPQMLIDTDFGAADRPVLSRGSQANPRVTGVLPAGWQDDSRWAPVWIRYGRMEEEGRGFTRMQVTRLDDGRAQLTYPLPDVAEESFYRLSLTARSVSSAAVQIGIRDSGAPYQFHWETRPQLSASWKDYSFDFRLAGRNGPIGLWLNLEGLGSLDLARLQLTRLTRADYIAELKSRYAEAPRNLLRISRFPLGLQSGWALDRGNSDGDDVTVAPDPAKPGPSGAPSLQVRTNEHTVLYSAPFAVPLAFQTHTASVYAQGSGTLRLNVLCDGKGIAQREFTLSGGNWQRLQLPFEPTLMARSYALRFEGDHTFWLDALQVAPGKEAGAYAAQLACEVSLACPASAASAALVQFPEDPALVRWCVSGAAAGAVLKSKVFNLYGEEQALPPATLAEGFLNSGQLRFDRFPKHPFGAFRIEAWVEDGKGTALSAPNEIVVYRLPRPRYWGKDAPNSPFGVHTLSTTRHDVMAKAVGVNWTRLHDAGLEYLGWYHLERQPGQWTFFDKEIQRYRRDHLKILGELGTAPEWASYFPKAHDRYFDRFYQPKRLEDYAHYVRTVTQRYKGVIDAYDVWNEPWIWAWWAVGYDESKSDRAGYITSKEPQADFARLMRTAYENAKTVDPKITILGVNSTTGGSSENHFSGTEWTRGVVDAGGLAFCDVVCYHNYIGGKPGYPGDVIDKGFQTATGPIQERFGKLPKPVWMTEGSAGRDVIGPGFYHYTIPYPNGENNFETADRLCRYVVSLLSQGVRRVFLYSMHAQACLGVPQSWRVLVTEEGMLHPSGTAHAAMAWQLEDTRFVKRIAVARGVYASLFTGKGRAVAVLSTAPEHERFLLAARKGITVTDLFGNPVAPDQPLGERLTYVSAASPAALEQALRAGGK